MREPIVILPAYNEAAVVAEVIQEIRSCGFEQIVLINDGSTDDTGAIAKANGAIVVTHFINRGAGAAVQTAIELARRQNWSRIAFMDADGQHQAEDIRLLAAEMDRSNCDLVIGSRFIGYRENIPWTRRIFNGIANLMTNIFGRQRFTDSQSGLRMLNRKAIESLHLKIDGFGYCSEMLIEAERLGLKINEIPTQVRYSPYSISKGQDFQMGINTALHFLWNVIFK
ncbi:MAG: glycosyltransferase family 2 protein [Bacteroidota bacterium]